MRSYKNNADLEILFYGGEDTVSVGPPGLAGVMSTLGLHVLLPVPVLEYFDSVHIENSPDRGWKETTNHITLLCNSDLQL